MKETVKKISEHDKHLHSDLEVETIEIEDSSKVPMNSTYPCTKCNCSDYEIDPRASIICKRCGHDSSAHGLP